MTFIKLCGLRDEATVDLAVELAADAVGFVLTPSVRRIDPDRAAALARRIPDSILAVGVFRDSSVDEVVDVARRAELTTVQMHNLVSPDQVDALHAAGLHVVRAASAGGSVDTLGADRLLVDGAVAGAGVTWDWTSHDAHATGSEWILAGGLSPSNVAEALDRTGASGVDVSSGIESAPGVKDPDLVRAFVDAVRSRRESPTDPST